MAYNELIKSFAKIRGYIREFYVYGFRHRLDMDEKSARSYDDERRRVESWLGTYMRSEMDPEGKRTFLYVDSRSILHNPLYEAFKTKSFTDNDVMLHFYLMDLLSETEEITIKKLIRKMETASEEEDLPYLDESTIFKKMEEYTKLGLVVKRKKGRENLYRKSSDGIDLSSWKNAVLFYSETAPLGVVGSFLLDKYRSVSEVFRFKHHHIMKALDSEILCTLLEAISEKRSVKLTQRAGCFEVIPYRILTSTWYGRQHVLVWDPAFKDFRFYRLDNILRAVPGKVFDEWKEHEADLEEFLAHVWGVSFKGNRKTEHIEFDLRLAPYESFVAERLQREKRCGTVEQLDEERWRFYADLYDSLEALPWVRSFTGRIERFVCDNEAVRKRFYEDLDYMADLYRSDEDKDAKGGE